MRKIKFDISLCVFLPYFYLAPIGPSNYRLKIIIN